MSSSGGTGRGRGGKGPATFFLRQLFQFSPRSGSSSHDEQSRGSGSPDLGESMGRIDLSSGGDGDGTDRRTEVQLVNGNLLPIGKKPNGVATSCTVSFKMYVDPMGYTWKNVTEEFKLMYWNEFCKQFRWSPPLTDGQVYDLWLKKAARRYTEFVSTEKNRRSTTGRSPYISEDIWEAGDSGFPSMGNDDERYQKLQTEYEAEKEQRQALERRTGGLEESHQQLQQSHHQVLDELKQTKLLLERLLRRDTQPDDE